MSITRLWLPWEHSRINKEEKSVKKCHSSGTPRLLVALEGELDSLLYRAQLLRVGVSSPVVETKYPGWLNRTRFLLLFLFLLLDLFFGRVQDDGDSLPALSCFEVRKVPFLISHCSGFPPHLLLLLLPLCDCGADTITLKD